MDFSIKFRPNLIVKYDQFFEPILTLRKGIYRTSVKLKTVYTARFWHVENGFAVRFVTAQSVKKIATWGSRDLILRVCHPPEFWSVKSIRNSNADNNTKRHRKWINTCRDIVVWLGPKNLNLKYDQISVGLWSRNPYIFLSLGSSPLSRPLISRQRFEQWSNGRSTRNRSTKLRRFGHVLIPLVERNSCTKNGIVCFGAEISLDKGYQKPPAPP